MVYFLSHARICQITQATYADLTDYPAQFLNTSLCVNTVIRCLLLAFRFRESMGFKGGKIYG